MDFSKFKTPDWLMIGGALGFLIFGTFVNWVGDDGAPTFNAFDWFVTGTIPWILIIGTGVIAFLRAGDIIKPAPKPPWNLILLIASALATLLVLLLVLVGPTVDFGGQSIDVKRGIGLWLSLISAGVVLAGAFMKFQSAGGNLKDFTDRDKMRNSFGGSTSSQHGGGTQPPPPPPGSPPPPPPAL